MTADNANEIVVRPVSPEGAREALSLVISTFDPEQRAQRLEELLALARSGTHSLAGLMEARRGGRLVGATLAEIQVGKTALVWPPRIAVGESLADNERPRSADHRWATNGPPFGRCPSVPAGRPLVAERLLDAVTQWLADGSICVAYALLETVTTEDDAVLRGGGYEPLAELLYLVCRREAMPPGDSESPLRYEPYSPANHQRFARSILATYRQTLDCPKLDGIRQIDDVLDGYRATGEFHPDRWLIVRHQDRDVGCLLLTDHPSQQSWELIYMGLEVPARGHGWGMLMTEHAQWLTRQAGRQRLALAVDAANQPALKIYAAAGFEAWQQRTVYLKVLDSPG